MGRDSRWAASALAAVLLLARAGAAADAGAEGPKGPEGRCRVSEYPCSNRRCVPVNRYCDNVNDCGDSSDEPRHCTPCNRTYYGDVGRTYDLELHRPKEDRLPFVCRITLTAGGGAHGDLVQLTLESFTLGRFVSFTVDGCPDGALQLGELGRPPVGGSWCGSSWGPAVYYSETRSLTLHVRLLRLSKDHTGYNFDFRMEYKMLPKDLATVRYGGALPASDGDGDGDGAGREAASPSSRPAPRREYYLGDLISGTYCSRIFSDCDRKACRLQSPNFPGVYPRNLTCYYAVRQHEVPPGKHALIAVRQRKGQLVSIRSRKALYAPAPAERQRQERREGGERARTLRVWGECDEVQDYVTVYDGYTTRDPVILKFCGGGEPVPESVSSGPELLVEFTTSPYGTFLHPTPAQSLHGFQLEVEVRFVDQQSPTYARNKRACEFWIRGTGRGVLESPQHSLSPNATCLYHLQGTDASLATAQGPAGADGRRPWARGGQARPAPRFRVWLSVLKFHAASALERRGRDAELTPPEAENCSSRLNVWDGPLRISPGCSDVFCDREKWRASRGGGADGRPVTVGRPPGNASLVARYCGGSVPRSCDHSLLRPPPAPPARPCARAESFLSTSDSMTLELRLSDSTSLRPVSFKALYEFVDLRQDGEPHGSGLCSRRFLSRSTEAAPEPPRRFAAPRDVFLYGRGGAENISCSYRFEAQRGERVRITVLSLRAAGGRCATRRSAATGRLACLGRPRPALRTYEAPWPGAPPLPRDCLCSAPPGLLPFVFESDSRVAEVGFEALGMSDADDFETLSFEGAYEFVRAPSCDGARRTGGPGGEIALGRAEEAPDDVNCERRPRLVEPSPGRYLYVRVAGTRMREPVVDDRGASGNVTILHEDEDRCPTRNRVAIYAGSSAPTIVCPAAVPGSEVVEAFSEGWAPGDGAFDFATGAAAAAARGRSRSIAVELIGREAGSYSVSWLELSKRRHNVFPGVFSASEECELECPELDACVNASLRCDGVAHCPSGHDESAMRCSALLGLGGRQLAALCAAALGCGALALLCAARARRRRRSTAFQRRLESLSSESNAFGDKEVIC